MHTPSLPTRTRARRVGGDCDEELMVDSLDIARARIEAIVAPIDRWLESLRIVKVRVRAQQCWQWGGLVHHCWVPRSALAAQRHHAPWQGCSCSLPMAQQQGVMLQTKMQQVR